jgi:pSer/pThr/pTyr-binding forkhead associated (FHA) protein
MSGQLTVAWSDGEQTFDDGAEVRIGRDPGCQVLLTNPSVSRVHAAIRFDGKGWVLTDLGSSQGTFRDGKRVEEVRLGAHQVVVLGAPEVGEPITLSTDAPAPTLRPPGAAAPDDGATVVRGERARPGGELRADITDSATVVAGSMLRVECGGRTHQFAPGRPIVVGRDETADVVTANPTVSRRHAVITHDGQGWVIEDAGSRGGTYVDGRARHSYRLSGTTAVWLGDPDAGERMVIVASGTKAVTPIDRVRRLSRSGMLGFGTAVFRGVVALVALAAVIWGGGSGGAGLDQLARGVVRVEAPGGGAGSGTVVDAERGLVLTTLHVANPRGGEPAAVMLWTSDGIFGVAQPRYVAEVVATDAYLDLAVLEITRTIAGDPIDPRALRGLTAIPIGSPGGLEPGEAVLLVGHGTAAGRGGGTTMSRGAVTGSVRDDRLGSPRGHVTLDADVEPGASGGLVADGRGRLVGLLTLEWFDPETGTVRHTPAMRPIGFAAELVEAARTGTPYESPFGAPRPTR